jgi:pre-mRNA-splicing factor CWC22
MGKGSATGGDEPAPTMEHPAPPPGVEEEGQVPETQDKRKPESIPAAAAVTAAATASRKRNIVSDGVYMPPAKRKQMELQAAAAAATEGNGSQQPDVDSPKLQRKTWDEEKRVVHGTINRLNATTIKPLIHDLFEKVNLIRMRGVLAKSILSAAISSPTYSNVYAALTAVLNSKLPEVGELVVKRAVLGFRRYYRRREKQSCLATALFLGHLFHQSVVHELMILQILTVLLDGDPTDDSVEVAVQLLTTTGYALLEVSPAGVRAVLERLRALLHEGALNKRVEYKMEKLLALRKTGFRDHPPIPEELDLIESDDQITFETDLDDEDIKAEQEMDVFRIDPEYEETREVWSKIRAEILGLGDDDGDSETDDDDDDNNESSDEESDDDEEEEQALVPAAANTGTVTVQDLSEADLIHLRRQIYLTIMSSATFEECTHKLAKIDIPIGKEEELINMLIECCSQERTFLRYYGLIGARFCLIHDRWRDAFMDSFTLQYTTIHRLETNKLRNVAKLFAHLVHSDALPWSVLSVIHLNEDETTSSSRIFVKILAQEMAEAIGIAKLKERFESDDPELKEWFKGMFPRDNVRNTRYAINFFTSIGLGPLTDGLREFLKNAPKLIMAQAQQNALAKKEESDDESSSSSSSSSSGSDSSSLSSSSSSSNSSSSSESSRSRRGRSRGRSRKKRARSESSSSRSSSTSSRRSRSYPRSDSQSVSRSQSRSPARRRRSPSEPSGDSRNRRVSGGRDRSRSRSKDSYNGKQRAKR